MFSRARIKRHAELLGISYESLKNQLDPLCDKFRSCCLAGDWSGCVTAIKDQNQLLQLYPKPIDYVQDDIGEDIALLEILERVAPNAFQLVLEECLSQFVDCSKLLGRK